MDEKTKEEINYILYTLEHYPHPEDLEWSTEQVKSLLSRIKELEGGIEEVLKWRNLDGDGISDPLREELYKLIGKEKK